MASEYVRPRVHLADDVLPGILESALQLDSRFTSHLDYGRGNVGPHRNSPNCSPPVMLLALAPANDGGIFPISDSWRYCAPKMESLVRVLRQSP